MARLQRRWRILKWTGLVVCSTLFMIWAIGVLIGDMQCYCGHWVVGLEEGNIWIRWDGAGTPSRWEWEATRIRSSPEWCVGWWPDLHIGARGGITVPFFLWLPLWVAFVCVGTPTVALFWRDRRRIPPSHCQKCGYDLTGNVSGICPECGVKVDTASAPKG